MNELIKMFDNWYFSVSIVLFLIYMIIYSCSIFIPPFKNRMEEKLNKMKVQNEK